MPVRPYDEYKDTVLWSAIEELVAELSATGEVAVNTAPQYVIGYICRELAAKKIVVAEALARSS